MDRLISEQKVLDAISEWKQGMNLYKLIKDIPSADEDEWVKRSDVLKIVDKRVNEALADKWIPVSERLPNPDEYIKNNGLFNVSDGNRSYSEWFDIYDTERFGEPTITGFRVDYAVIAWMPLPQPYKAESEE